MLIKSDYALLSALTLGRHKTKIVSEPKGRPQTLKIPMIDTSADLPWPRARGSNLSFTDICSTPSPITRGIHHSGRGLSPYIGWNYRPNIAQCLQKILPTWSIFNYSLTVRRLSIRSIPRSVPRSSRCPLTECYAILLVDSN